MFSFWLAFLGISFVSAIALSLVDSPTLAASQALWNSSDLFEALPSLTNSTKSSTPFTNRVIDWECSWTFGRGNYGTSCFDAARQIAFVPGSATRQFTWGMRDLGTYDVPLPQIVYSCKAPNLLRLLLSNKEILSRRTLQYIGRSHVQS